MGTPRELDDCGICGYEDADDREWLTAVRAVVLPAGGSDVVARRSWDDDAVGDDVRDDVVVAVAVTPGGFAAELAAVALARLTAGRDRHAGAAVRTTDHGLS